MSFRTLRNSVSIVAVFAYGQALAAEGPMIAANVTPASAANIFGLGQIEQVTITASPFAPVIGESTVEAEDIYKFNATTLDRAIDLVAGANASTTGGPRNERLFFIRGFDRFQAPLFIDGIRVYLPVDNRVDVGFFNTANLSQIQVQKGYVSVLSGPGALGGAINLVTRKPTKAFEYEARSGVALAGSGSYNGYNASLLAGGATQRYYWQASGTMTRTDKWELSEDYKPSASENGGPRNHSESGNWGANFKFGVTPNATDEYSLSYSGTWGEKNAAFSTIEALAGQKDWRWPYWDLQNIYFLSHTSLGGSAYVETKAFYTEFKNLLVSFDNANFNTQRLARSFDSYYDDNAWGGSIEAGTGILGERDLIKGAFFFRRDIHREWQTVFSPRTFTEPVQPSVEDTFSIAGENRFHVTNQIDFVAGASYDWRKLHKAIEFIDPTATVPGSVVVFPLSDGDALNGQGALIYNYSGSGHVYANISSRARFPTLMDRFSTRFGSSLSNPDLKEERMTNFEIGGGDTFAGVRPEGAAYYREVSNFLESVPIIFCDTTSVVTPKNCVGIGGAAGVNTAVNQTQNVGNGHFLGFELSADTRVFDNLQLGIRYSYIDRTLDAQDPANPALPANFHLTGVPQNQIFAYATWDILPGLSFTPSIQAATRRWSNTQTTNLYIQTGSYFMVNFTAQYALTETIDIEAGGRNLFDENYQFTNGFPQEGRSFFVNVRMRN